jgi:hypothetical protein
MIDWQQQRNPEDVPTPVAVALADYCRRNKMPSTPKRIRAALAMISEHEDGLVKQIADGEAQHQGLGPMALVDIVKGTALGTVRQRQEDGVYDSLVVSAGFVRAKPETQPVISAEVEAPAAAVGVVRHEPKKAVRKTKAQSIAEKIKPKKRDRFEPEPMSDDSAVAQTKGGASFLTKRNLPAPRGRFTMVDPSKLSVETLMKSDAKPMLEALVDQSLHRDELFRALESGYTGKKGHPLSADDLMLVLDKHGLKRTLEQKERAMILSGIVEQRGALGRLAKAKNLSENSLKELIFIHKLKREVGEASERYTKEALANGNLGVRLDLLFKTAYLKDLDIELKFRDRLKAELKLLIQEVLPDVTNIKDLVQALAKKHALDKELLLKALEKLQLTSLT